jgi:hypothetical protein
MLALRIAPKTYWGTMPHTPVNSQKVLRLALQDGPRGDY